MTPADFAAAYERHRVGLLVYCARRVGDATLRQALYRAIVEAGTPALLEGDDDAD